MEMRIQYHFQNPQAISFPMVPDFAQIDEEKVKLEQFKNFCWKKNFLKYFRKFSPKLNLFCIIAMSKLIITEQLTTPWSPRSSPNRALGFLSLYRDKQPAPPGRMYEALKDVVIEKKPYSFDYDQLFGNLYIRPCLKELWRQSLK